MRYSLKYVFCDIYLLAKAESCGLNKRISPTERVKKKKCSRTDKRLSMPVLEPSNEVGLHKQFLFHWLLKKKKKKELLSENS